MKKLLKFYWNLESTRKVLWVLTRVLWLILSFKKVLWLVLSFNKVPVTALQRRVENFTPNIIGIKIQVLRAYQDRSTRGWNHYITDLDKIWHVHQIWIKTHKNVIKTFFRHLGGGIYAPPKSPPFFKNWKKYLFLGNYIS